MMGFLAFIFVAIGTIAFVALFRPFPKLWLPTRKRAAAVWLASIILFFIVAPKPTPAEKEAQRIKSEKLAVEREKKARADKKYRGKARPSRSETEDDLTDSFSGRSPKCGPVIGETQQDLRNVEEFCSVGIPAGAVEGAYAMGSLLWIKITRPMADQLRAANSLDAESLVRNWMRGWKQSSKSKAVTVTIEWRDIEIAKGETTLLSGDKVTIHR